MPVKNEQRIAKVIAQAGLCSRRDAENWISDGRVSLNGIILSSPAINVKPGDKIAVDKKPLPESPQTRLWLYHKPVGLITTHKDPQNRPTVFDNLPQNLPRVLSVGRLDINTQGLLLLTNNGGLAGLLEHPATGWKRRYRVRAFGDILQETLDTLKEGITINGIHYGPILSFIERKQGGNIWLIMTLSEGKNREIKNVLEHFGLKINRLIRVSYGPFSLGTLASGAVEEVKTRVLCDQLGARMVAEAGIVLPERKGYAEGKPAKKPADSRKNRLSSSKK